MEQKRYRPLRLHAETHHILRKLAATWGISMLEAVDRLVSEAWRAEQQKEQEQRDSGVHDPMHDTEGPGR